MSNSRDLNRARVFEIIHLYEPISRSEIAKHVGLTTASITYIIAELLELGFVKELGRRQTARGQPAIELGVAADSAYTIGLHFNDEHIRGALIDLKGTIVIDVQEVLPQPPTPTAVINALVKVGEKLKKKVPKGNALAAGLAAVGPIDLLQGSVKQTAFAADWHNVPLRQPLAEALSLPVYMDNNATAAAIGEFWYGKGRDYQNFLNITFFGKGLGGGLILDRRVYRGSGLNAAEFGHVLVQPKKPHVGVTPFLENYVSGFALLRDFGNDIVTEFSDRLAAKDKKLCKWMETASGLFANAIVSVDHMLNLDAIIVGGQLPSTFTEELLRLTHLQLDSLYMRGWSDPARLLQCNTGDDNAVLGAATLPIYDALAMPAHATGMKSTLFRSTA